MKKNLLTKIRNRKGFTLAELLIVVAIIGVLVAVSIPIFTAQLAKARLATNQANARAAVAEATAEYLTAGEDVAGIQLTYNVSTGKGTIVTDSTASKGNQVATSNDIASWNTSTAVGKGSNSVTLGSKTFSTWYVTVTDAGVTYIGAN